MPVCCAGGNGVHGGPDERRARGARRARVVSPCCQRSGRDAGPAFGCAFGWDGRGTAWALVAVAAAVCVSHVMTPMPMCLLPLSIRLLACRSPCGDRAQCFWSRKHVVCEPERGLREHAGLASLRGDRQTGATRIGCLAPTDPPDGHLLNEPAPCGAGDSGGPGGFSTGAAGLN